MNEYFEYVIDLDDRNTKIFGTISKVRLLQMTYVSNLKLLYYKKTTKKRIILMETTRNPRYEKHAKMRFLIFFSKFNTNNFLDERFL